MAEFSESDKPDITSREHLRRHHRLARQRAALRAARTIAWCTVAIALIAAVLADAALARAVTIGGVLSAAAAMAFEHHLIDRYLIETFADEIVYLAVTANPGHCAITYTTKLATIPPHETQKALHRLEDTQRLRAERQTLPTGHTITVYYRHD